MSRDISFYDESRSQPPTVREAGQLGGLAVLKKWGRAYFREIGKMGQIAMRKKHPNMASEWGRKGGRPKKPKLREINGGER